MLDYSNPDRDSQRTTLKGATVATMLLHNTRLFIIRGHLVLIGLYLPLIVATSRQRQEALSPIVSDWERHNAT
ncbi:uncharacterized protein B0T23DRAFT_27169 [Neurospora hispaniola]|uniref:Uncharacterized protein n=1 Tax=Neurospora hispaniola TaxID=588809 RepID=A0AAJ0MW08_9PEZI|nr:hypothetical protein B0T23DRAFT_27169 [Neurospora hispaniola]